tara:strand:+ start:99 stop:245 length:147 start_codon:yes stop_codon:yes gene_type:complete
VVSDATEVIVVRILATNLLNARATSPVSSFDENERGQVLTSDIKGLDL